jgi:MFS transporter, FHS family, glucose/mannose:H+ symporter
MSGLVRLAPTSSRLFAHATAGQFIFGLVLALPGTLFGTPAWTTAVGCDVAAQANLLVVFFFGQLTCTAAAGIAVDHLGAQRVLTAGTGLLTLGFLALAAASTPGAAALGFALLAAGGSSINAASNTLVSVTFGERRGTMLSLLGVASGVGACLAPFVVGITGVSGRLAVLAALSVLLTLVPLVVGQAIWTSRGVTLRAMVGLGRDHRFAGLILWLGVEFGVEAILAGWSAAYALAAIPGARPGLVVVLYWAGLCMGRVTAPLALQRSSKLVTVGVAAGLVAVAIGAMAQASTWSALTMAVFAAGFAVGPLAPTIIAVAGDRYPQQSGLAIGVLVSVAQLGAVLLPWITGRVAIAEGFRAALLIPLAAAIVLSLSAGAFRVRRALRTVEPSRSEPA